MKFFDDAGKMAIGSRLRSLSELMTQDAREIYDHYGTQLQPKWLPVFYALSKGEELTVTEISEYIGHSHVSVSKIVSEMSREGLLVDRPDSADRRRTRLRLSKSASVIAKKIELQYQDVAAAVEHMTSRTKHDLWAALQEWENLLDRKSLKSRVLLEKRRRESEGVVVEDYRPQHKKDFYRLNEEWISKYFKLEQVDKDAIGNPQEYILNRGGQILVATANGDVLGVCALLVREDLEGFELAKMAVSPKAQGRGVGLLLGEAAIERAFELGAKRVYLESNSRLKPAIELYKKLGFKDIGVRPSPYERVDVWMELEF